jgi:hypothetical protein
VTRQLRRAAERAVRKLAGRPAVTVVAVAPECVSMAPRFYGPALLSSRVEEGRGYVLVRGAMRPTTYDDGDEVIVETKSFATMDDANAWIAADVAARRRPS